MSVAESTRVEDGSDEMAAHISRSLSRSLGKGGSPSKTLTVFPTKLLALVFCGSLGFGSSLVQISPECALVYSSQHGQILDRARPGPHQLQGGTVPILFQLGGQQ